MGSLIEFNDTLQITTEQGFPKGLDLKKHLKKPFTTDDVKNKTFEFKKPGRRIFHAPPTRCFLVHNINEKWLYWGHCEIVEQTIKGDITTGKFRIIKIYTPEHQRAMSTIETSKGN